MNTAQGRGHPSDRDLFELAEGELPPERGNPLWGHVSQCPECRQRFAEWTDTQRMIAELPVTDAPSRVMARVRQRLTEPEPSHVPAWTQWVRLRWAAAAAAVVVLVAAMFGLHSYWQTARRSATTTAHMARPAVQPEPKPQVADGLRPSADWGTVTATAKARALSPQTRVATTPRAFGPVHIPVSRDDRGVGERGTVEGPPPASAAVEHPVVKRESAADMAPTDAAPTAQPLAPGETLQTGDTDRAFVELPDGGQVVVGFDTQIETAKTASLGEDSGFSVRLARGEVWAWSPGDGGKISVLTPKGSGSVHHGQAMVRLYGSGAVPHRARGAQLEVLSLAGRAEFADPSGRVTELRPGQVMLAAREPGGLRLEPQAFEQIIEIAGGWGRRKDAWQVWPLTGADLLSQLDAPRIRLGVKLVATSEGQSGLQVATVLPGSTAERAGLQPGDVIVQIGDREVNTVRDVAAAELLLAGREAPTIAVRRGDAALSLALPAVVSPPTLCEPEDTAVEEVALLAATGDVERAADECARVANARPADAGHWYNLGVLREYQDRLGDALAAYKGAHGLEPDQPRLLVALGRLYARIGNLGQARALLLKADEIHPSGSVRYLLGRVAIFDKDFEGAEYWSNQLLASESDEDKAWGEVLADQLAYTRSDLATALHRAESALALDPGNLRAMYDVASRTLQAQRAREARKLARPLLRICPDLLAAINLMGDAAHKLGEWEEAGSWAERGLALHPRSPVLLCNRAHVSLNEGRHDDAVRDYEEAIRLDPSFIPAHTGLGEAATQAGRPSVAAEHFEQALRLAPGDSEVLGKAIKAHKALGQHEEAERLLRRYELSALPR